MMLKYMNLPFRFRLRIVHIYIYININGNDDELLGETPGEQQPGASSKGTPKRSGRTVAFSLLYLFITNFVLPWN